MSEKVQAKRNHPHGSGVFSAFTGDPLSTFCKWAGYP
jgi:hypothetical protein